MKYLLVAVNAKYIHSNLGVYSLKAYAEEYGAAACVELAEYTINSQPDQVMEDIYRRKPDFIGFSCYIWNIVYMENLIRDLARLLPDTEIWMGGPEVSYDTDMVMEKLPMVRGIMSGEGEETFARLTELYERWGREFRYENSLFWKQLSALKGITFRDVSGQIRNHGTAPVMDLNSIPFAYKNLDVFQNRIIYYESSRGCPFSCSYCLSSIDKTVRFRDLQLVRQELSFFLEHQVAQVKFVDRTFNCSRRHAMEIWQYLSEHDNGITNFHFEISADLLGEEELNVISAMRPGLIQLEIGVQTTNQNTIHEIHRRTDLKRLKQTVERINRFHNVHQHLDLIAGLPFEDYTSFQVSFCDVYRMKPEQLQLGFLKVLKGSYMAEMAEEYGILQKASPPYEVMATRWLSYEEILKLKAVEDMVEVYYNSGQFCRTLEKLEQEFETPYIMFWKLARFYDDSGFRGMNHSRLARYEILHRFVGTLGITETELREYEDRMVFDLYLRENAKSRPHFARDQSLEKDRRRELFPELRKLGAMVHLEIFHDDTAVLFDYRERDPLNHNAKAIRLE